MVLGENFVNGDNVYTLTNGSGAAYLYDQKADTQCASSGSSEGASWQLLIEFYDRAGNAVSRTLDSLVMLNHNLAKFKWEYWNGSAWTTITESDFTVAANAQANLYIAMAASVSTQKLRLSATNTIGAAAEKLIAEVKACLSVTSVRHLVAISRKDWDDGGNFRLVGGALVTFMNVRKFEADITILDLAQATYELLMPLVRARSWMTFILWSDFQPADVFEVAAVDQPKEQLNRKTQMYTVAFPVKER